jgi:hypothetical protein
MDDSFSGIGEDGQSVTRSDVTTCCLQNLLGCEFRLASPSGEARMVVRQSAKLAYLVSVLFKGRQWRI